MPGKTKPFGLRLTDSERALVEEHAAKTGQKPSQYAKKILLEGVLGDNPAGELSSIRDRLDELEEGVGAIRKNFWNAMLVLLTRQEPMTAEEANSWIKERFE